VAAREATGERVRAISSRGDVALALTALLALVPALFLGEGDGLAPLLEPDQAYAAADSPCGGVPMAEPDRVVTGSFGNGVEGSYVMVPFDVPAGTDAVRVKYCHDQPLLTTVPGTDQVNKHTIDMGVYGPRAAGDELWDEDEFRGWGGSSRKDVTISPEASIDPDPAPVATTQTTVGYRPGPITAGQWAVELGVAAIGAELPTEDGQVAWRVEIDLIDDPAFADQPYEPVTYDETPANPAPGWYSGDFHVHARNSAPGDATMRDTFDYAFAPFGEGAGLDFITLSDYVTDRSWGEIGAFQDDYPGKLIVRSSEVITYRGHMNNHGGGEFVDYRTGPIYQAELTGGPGVDRQVGALDQVRPAQPASRILEDIRDGGGWNQLNHVETFPSEVPTFGNLCRGCSWEYSDAETEYSGVDAIEVATGPAGLEVGQVDPGPNPFTPLAVLFYEHALDADGRNSNRIAAVGSSDSHHAGESDNPLTQAPIGTAQTVVRADELSEEGLAEGVAEQHTYVKIWGSDGPELRFEATAPGMAEPAIMGDTVAAAQATLTARVLGLDRARAARAGVYTLVVLRDGLPFLELPMLLGDTFEFSFPSLGAPSRYSLMVERIAVGASVEAVSSPIWVDPAGDPEDVDPPDPPPPPDPPATCAEAPPVELTDAADGFSGTDGSDRVHARGGADRVRGHGGHDCLAGNRGRDRLRGDAGEDLLAGGFGSDRIGAADGEPDRVRCGAGRRDAALVDPGLDTVRGCERVRAATG
jgi:hypothetical protein